MKWLLNWIEHKFAPAANKFTQQKHMKAIQNGMIASSPLALTGAMFLVIYVLPIPGVQQFWDNLFGTGKAWSGATKFLAPFNLTVGIFSIFVCISIAQALARHYKLNEASSGNIAIAIYFMTLLAPHMAKEGWDNKLSVGSMGPTSLFGGILVAIYAVEMFRFCKEKNLYIKMPDIVPKAVRDSFAALIPGLIIILPAWAAIIFGFDIHNLAQVAISPLEKFLVGKNIFGLMLVMFLSNILWCVGIHGPALVMTFVNPFSAKALLENANALQAGQEMPHIITSPLISVFGNAGGSGFTWGLLIAIFIGGIKSPSIKTVAKGALFPGIFNINEPIIFGIPIVANPILMIPFVIGPMLTTGLTFLVMKLNLVGRAYIGEVWTVPGPINAFFITKDWKAVIWWLMMAGLMTVLYLPFIKMYDRQKMVLEVTSENRK